MIDIKNIIAALETAADKSAPLLAFPTSDLGGYFLKDDCSPEQSIELIQQGKRLDDPGLSIEKAIEALSLLDQECELPFNVDLTTKELVMYVDDDDSPIGLCLPQHAAKYPDGGIASEGAIFETLLVGTPVLIGDSNKYGYISIPIDESMVCRYDTDITISRLKKALESNSTELLYCIISSPEGIIGSHFRMLGGGNLLVNEEGVGRVKAVEMMALDAADTLLTVNIDSEIADYLQIEDLEANVTIDVEEDDLYLIQTDEEGLVMADNWEEGCLELPKGTAYISVTFEDDYSDEDDE